MEYSSFVDLPDDRCGFSDREHTCVSPAWHGGFHRMVPRSWISHTAERVPAVREAAAPSFGSYGDFKLWKEVGLSWTQEEKKSSPRQTPNLGTNVNLSTNVNLASTAGRKRESVSHG